MDFFSPWIFTISNPLSHDSAALQHACSLTKAKFPEQKSRSLPHQAADERVHGLEPDRAPQDNRGDAGDAQRGDLKVPWQEMEDTVPGNGSPMEQEVKVVLLVRRRGHLTSRRQNG